MNEFIDEYFKLHTNKRKLQKVISENFVKTLISKNKNEISKLLESTSGNGDYKVLEQIILASNGYEFKNVLQKLTSLDKYKSKSAPWYNKTLMALEKLKYSYGACGRIGRTYPDEINMVKEFETSITNFKKEIPYKRVRYTELYSVDQNAFDITTLKDINAIVTVFEIHFDEIYSSGGEDKFITGWISEIKSIFLTNLVVTHFLTCKDFLDHQNPPKSKLLRVIINVVTTELIVKIGQLRVTHQEQRRSDEWVTVIERHLDDFLNFYYLKSFYEKYDKLTNKLTKDELKLDQIDVLQYNRNGVTLSYEKFLILKNLDNKITSKENKLNEQQKFEKEVRRILSSCERMKDKPVKSISISSRINYENNPDDITNAIKGYQNIFGISENKVNGRVENQIILILGILLSDESSFAVDDSFSENVNIFDMSLNIPLKYIKKEISKEMRNEYILALNNINEKTYFDYTPHFLDFSLGCNNIFDHILSNVNVITKVNLDEIEIKIDEKFDAESLYFFKKSSKYRLPEILNDGKFCLYIREFKTMKTTMAKYLIKSINNMKQLIYLISRCKFVSNEYSWNKISIYDDICLNNFVSIVFIVLINVYSSNLDDFNNSKVIININLKDLLFKLFVILLYYKEDDYNLGLYDGELTFQRFKTGISFPKIRVTTTVEAWRHSMTLFKLIKKCQNNICSSRKDSVSNVMDFNTFLNLVLLYANIKIKKENK